MPEDPENRLTGLYFGVIRSHMNIRVLHILVIAVILGLAGCVAHVRSPSWYPSGGKGPGYYYGAARGVDYGTARTGALAALCRSIRVKVSTSVELKRQQSVSGSNRGEDVSYKELSQTITRAGARCAFKGPVARLIREIHADQAGSAYYVMLKMSVARYIRLLSHRTVVVKVVPLENTGAAAPLVNLAVQDLMDNGFVVMETGARAPFFTATIRFEQKTERPGVSGLMISSVNPVYTVKEKANNRVVKRVAPGVVTARGFRGSVLIQKLAVQAARALQKGLE